MVMYKYALIVKVMIIISPARLNDMQPNIVKDLENLLVFFE